MDDSLLTTYGPMIRYLNKTTEHEPNNRWHSLLNTPEAHQKIRAGESISAIARALNTSRQTIMRIRDAMMGNIGEK